MTKNIKKRLLAAYKKPIKKDLFKFSCIKKCESCVGYILPPDARCRRCKFDECSTSKELPR